MTIRRNKWVSTHESNSTSSIISAAGSGLVGLGVILMVGFYVFDELNTALEDAYAEQNLTAPPIVDFDISDNVKYINDSNLNNTITTRTYNECFKDMTKQGYNTYAIESLCTQETGGN